MYGESMMRASLNNMVALNSLLYHQFLQSNCNLGVYQSFEHTRNPYIPYTVGDIGLHTIHISCLYYNVNICKYYRNI